MLWQGKEEPEVGGKLGAVLSCGVVWLCQQHAALEKANLLAASGKVFSADLTLVQGAAGISPEGAVPLLLQQEEIQSKEGGKGSCWSAQTEPLG